MLKPEARRRIMELLPSDDYDDISAVNALLCAAFHLKGLTPVTECGTHTFETQWGENTRDEYPGQMRGNTGWLFAPSYLTSMEAACDLVETALGNEWIIETQVRADGSTAQLHQFPMPCRRSKIWRSGPGARGAAAAIVRCVLEMTELTDQPPT